MTSTGFSFFYEKTLKGFVASLALATSIHISTGSDAHAASFGLKKVAEGLVSPMVVAPLGDGSATLLVVDQVGVIHLMGKDGKLADKPYLDLTSKLTKLNPGFDERGLLGLALHPKFQENGRFFVYYSAPKRASAPKEWDHTSRISEFRSGGKGSLQADPNSEKVIMEIDQPYMNHNSGRLAFGPDGFLYIAVGDGGNSNDQGMRPPEGNGQNLNTHLGKILRIDVDKGSPYGIPNDNPYADGKNGKPEIFAYGLRNPWGISFDRGGSRQLYAADVGQTRYEEVNVIVKGGNYGWNVLEGFECFNPKSPGKPLEDCPKVGANGEPFREPLFVYKNINGFRNDPEGKGISITGGYIYRGKALPELNGKYVFADWSRAWAKPDGVVYVASPSGPNAKNWDVTALKLASHPSGSMESYVVAMGEDADGELYVMTNDKNGLIGKSGKVYKLVAH